jgi:serine/threonine-protein kinase RsbT
MQELRVEINCEQDVVTSRYAMRKAAQSMGFSLADETKIAIAASELARNIFLHAGHGSMECREVTGMNRQIGLEMVFEDNGPGIPNVEQAMIAGYSTGVWMGMGLGGSKQLMDEFTIDSRVGEGTTVRILKWIRV